MRTNTKNWNYSSFFWYFVLLWIYHRVYDIRIKDQVLKFQSTMEGTPLYLFFSRDLITTSTFFFFFNYFISLLARYIVREYNEESVATKYDFWCWPRVFFFCTGATLILIISARIYPRSYVLSPVTLARSI